MSDWQPAETAPLDEWVLVFGDPWNEGEPSVGVARASKHTYERWEMVSQTRQELISEERIEWEGADVIATHWMPLPSPPSTIDKEI